MESSPLLLVTPLLWGVEAKTPVAVTGAQLFVLPAGQRAEVSPFTNTKLGSLLCAVVTGLVIKDSGVDWTGEASTLLMTPEVGLFV